MALRLGSVTQRQKQRRWREFVADTNLLCPAKRSWVPSLGYECAGLSASRVSQQGAYGAGSIERRLSKLGSGAGYQQRQRR